MNDCLKIIFICASLLTGNLAKGQTKINKLQLDTSSLSKWPYVNDPKLTDNGTFAAYCVHKGYGGESTMYLKSISGTWGKSYPGVSVYSFSQSNRQVVFLNNNGELNILTLGTEMLEQKQNVLQFELFICSGKEWLLYTNEKSELHLRNMSTGKDHVYKNVLSYFHNRLFNSLIFSISQDGDKLVSWLELNSLKQSTIITNVEVDNLTMDDKGTQLAYVYKEEIYYCKLGKSIPRRMFSSNENSSHGLVNISSIERFSRDGLRLFIRLKDKASLISTQNKKTKVQIWSNQDVYLKSVKDKPDQDKAYLYSLECNRNNLRRIEQKYESVSFLNPISDNYLSLEYNAGDKTEQAWNENAKSKYFIYNCENGIRKALDAFPLSVSPDNRFLLTIDGIAGNLSLIQLNTDNVFPLTKGINSFGDQSDIPQRDKESWIFAGWLNSDQILLYDKHDIWAFNVNYPNKAFNLTNGYGKSNNITFRLACPLESNIYKKGTFNLLSAFNNRNKQNGFFSLSAQSGKAPELLCMSDAFYTMHERNHLKPVSPMKAKSANVWILSKEDAKSSPNYVTTSDFKQLNTLSNVYPEKAYPWLTSELINFTTTNGSEMQGIMYKPENFDTSRKYPVIIKYYEAMSDALHIYQRPDLSDSDINIPWFVSKGFLVCIPDITYTKGNTGENALSSVLGFTNCISKYPYIDSLRIGINGHSFGGYETNYIIANSSRFTAAVSACGNSDLISAIGSISFSEGTNRSGYQAEFGQGRLGYNLWERSDLYIKNSPIFKVDKIQTPLLLLANEKDGAVNYTQGLELFIALRRLNKTVWMLNYPDDVHVLLNDKNALDYTYKMLDFFNFYLKDEAMPKWMKIHD